jgi:hypothetical protein
MIIPQVKDIIETVSLSDGFVLFESDTGFYLAICTTNAGIAACHKIDKAAYDCMKRREGVKQ